MKRKGQLKIQEMAFVLMAIMIFFALVGLFFIKLRSSGLQNQAEDTKQEIAQQLVLVLANTPELAWGGCANCLDLDKALIVREYEKKDGRYSELWKLDFLALERLYPLQKEGECELGSYPDCNMLILINESKDFGTSAKSFVSVCRRDTFNDDIRCGLGVLYASGRSVANG